LVTDGGKTIAQVSTPLDLTETTLRDWVKRVQIDSGKGPQDALTTAESVPPHQRVELARHPSARRREVCLDRDAFSGARVDDVEGTEPSTLGEVVMDQVHRPPRVRSVWQRQRRGARSSQRLAASASDCEFVLAIEPFDALAIDPTPIGVATMHRVDATEARSTSSIAIDTSPKLPPIVISRHTRALVRTNDPAPFSVNGS
jgi:hypothetical protein